ncbi:DUF4355 domain-containing protein [Staphylococcus epidermidis]|uniref:DUF4355 domain-containing protein n=1 Tax=Staphylococcus epidermidis TaxID=1282 RepID=UPI00138ADCC0|nr:DUF4355 domain-containing protein [Staphylococcus epidermidis]MBF2188644.1 DUF4355 domain-containing protein [Staphylococcus epidermidis]MBM6184531.1 DUF4355 domain-containing protein [Staphylococcus epidermidis]MBM6197627.1 DUF4355 domain-containing protein [Staphylococcus epidermidis]MBM6370610.1 DUF4355 domain-containing protein [Staphylococcus epidermidis]MCG2106436.1 DUF4355 domain-containing protein [Staphylococcus epidermidis]
MQTKKTNMLKLKLQFFAEEPGDNAQTSEGQEKQDTPKKVYSEEEFNQRLNSELQRRLKQKEDEKAEAVKEAQKLAKMNKDQQLQYENEKLTKQLEEYKVRDAKSQMKAEARLMLNKEGIDVTEEPLLDMLVTSNAEDTKKNVETFSNLLNKIVQSNVERALRQDSPVSTQLNRMTKDEILAIKDDTQRQAAIAKNINLFS